uniref:Uncharacterized protein n=1 Tax=Megaselia scalaris TaxID=36166 RepID=T1GVN8_MEGSC
MLAVLYVFFDWQSSYHWSVCCVCHVSYAMCHSGKKYISSRTYKRKTLIEEGAELTKKIKKA